MEEGSSKTYVFGQDSQVPAWMAYGNNGGCEGEELDGVVWMIESGYLDMGFTWSDCEERKSVIIIGQTSDAAQFNDTYDHEKGHLAMHICQEYGMDPFSEKYQYLTGEIGRQMFIVAKHYLCDHCRDYQE